MSEEEALHDHCPRCSNAVEMKPLDRVSAEDAPLKLSVTGMPAAKCAKGTPRRSTVTSCCG